jgi:hypothetical protein
VFSNSRESGSVVSPLRWYQLRFPEEIEPRPLNHSRPPSQLIRPEKDRGPEDALEGSHQAAVFLAAVVQPEGGEHLGGAFEPHHWGLVLHRKVAGKIGTIRSCPNGRRNPDGR